MKNISVTSICLIVFFILGFFFFLPKTVFADACTLIDSEPVGGWSYESDVCNGTTPKHVNTECKDVISNGVKTGTQCCIDTYFADYCSSNTIAGHFEGPLWVPDHSFWYCCTVPTPTPTPTFAPSIPTPTP